MSKAKQPDKSKDSQIRELHERVTELERSEAELHQQNTELEQSEARLHRLIETAGDGVYILDPSFRYKWANQAFLDTRECSLDEIVGRAVTEVFGPKGGSEEDNKRYQKQYTDYGIQYRDQLLSGHPTNLHEYYGYTTTGKLVWTEVSNWMLMEDGERVEIIGIARDITKRKLAEIELEKSFDRIRTTLTATVSALAYAVEMRDPYTAGHQRRVANLACAIGGILDLPEEELDGLRLAALVHDVGKMRVPTDILTNPGKLTDAEFSIIKTHSQVGYDVLKGVDFVRPVAAIVHQHHERADGSGYPLQLSGDEILLEARILAVADVIEAIASHRPYRPALGIEIALGEITEHSGTRYDSRIAEACVRLLNETDYRLPQ